MISRIPIHFGQLSLHGGELVSVEIDMLVEDQIYGAVEVTDALLIELLQTPAINRLRGVHMGGIVGLLGAGPTATRYDHSVGTMLLVRRLGGGVEEQAAALLHDVSHTALSHVIDFVLDTATRQAFHDDQKQSYLMKTEVPAICERNGVDWRLLSDERCWPLLEQDPPRLCADRVDYTWRDVEMLGILTKRDCEALTEALRIHDGRLAFVDAGAAVSFAEAYLACDELCWSNPSNIGLYVLTAKAIGIAMNRGAMSRNDLWATDVELWAQVSNCSDPEVRQIAARIQRDRSFLFDPNGDIHVTPKVRVIDPDVICDGHARPLSVIDAVWREKKESYVRTKSGEWTLRIVDEM